MAESGYTKVPNYILSLLYGSKLNGSEASVYAYIIRKTVGFHKTKDKISISQISNATNVSEKGVIRAIKSLEKRGLITVRRKEKLTNIIGLASDKIDRRASDNSVHIHLSNLSDTKENQKDSPPSGMGLYAQPSEGKEIYINKLNEELGDEYE